MVVWVQESVEELRENIKFFQAQGNRCTKDDYIVRTYLPDKYGNIKRLYCSR